jgi:hypothetical protein
MFKDWLSKSNTMLKEKSMDALEVKERKIH